MNATSIFDLVDIDESELESILMNFLKKTKQTSGRQGATFDYFIRNINEPDESLIKHFKSVTLIDFHEKDMIEIYSDIQELAQGNSVLLTEWGVPTGGDEYTQLVKDLKGGIVFLAYPLSESQRISRGSKNKYSVSYCTICPENYESENDFNDFLEYWFRGFDGFSGYVVEKKDLEKFGKYMLKTDGSIELESDFKRSVKGFFSGVHELQILVYFSFE